MQLRVGKHSATKADRFWGCTRYPACQGAHGAHADGRPLGIPADRKTRACRMAAHRALDRFQARAGISRSLTYKWLAATLGLSKQECHIGRFDEATCDRVVKICESFWKNQQLDSVRATLAR